jgi:hypothetical protein
MLQSKLEELGAEVKTALVPLISGNANHIRSNTLKS